MYITDSASRKPMSRRSSRSAHRLS